MPLFKSINTKFNLYLHKFFLFNQARKLYKYVFLLPLCMLSSYASAAGCLKYGDTITAFFGTNYKFLVAEQNGDANANRHPAAQWESFLVQDTNGNTNGNDVKEGDKIALLSYHNRYLVAEPNGDVNANRTAIGDWEKWRIDKFNGASNNPNNCVFMSSVSEQAMVGLRSHHGKYLQATSSGGAEARLSNLDTASMPSNTTWVNIKISDITVPPVIVKPSPSSTYSCPRAFPMLVGSYSNKSVCMARFPAKIKNSRCNKRGGMKWSSGSNNYCLWGKSNYWHARPTK